MADRGGVVIIVHDKVAVIKRKKGTKEYYVFPGGQQEPNETIDQTAIREAYEELGVHVVLDGLLVKVPFNGWQYYFLAHITGGTFGTGQGEEFQGVNEGSYEATWLPIDMLQNVDIFPDEVLTKITKTFPRK